jgi:hypothetical protein
MVLAAGSYTALTEATAQRPEGKRSVEPTDRDSVTVWCPSCGAEYRTGAVQCADCRVALVADKPRVFTGRDDSGEEDALVELGEWPRLQAQILRRRLESAGIPVMIEWSGTTSEATGVLVVPEEHGDFAVAVVNELGTDEEVPDASPHAYLGRIEEHLAAAAALLEELRTRLDDLEAEDRT